MDPHQCRGLVRWHMDRAMLQDHLSATERRLTEAERNIASQRELVAQLERDGLDTAQPTLMLEQFEEVLAMHIADRDRLRAEPGLPTLQPY